MLTGRVYQHVEMSCSRGTSAISGIAILDRGNSGHSGRPAARCATRDPAVGADSASRSLEADQQAPLSMTCAATDRISYLARACTSSLHCAYQRKACFELGFRLQISVLGVTDVVYHIETRVRWLRIAARWILTLGQFAQHRKTRSACFEAIGLMEACPVAPIPM